MNQPEENFVSFITPDKANINFNQKANSNNNSSFAGSENQSQKSRLSERRYTMEEDSDIFDELDPAAFPNDSGYGFCFDNIMPTEKQRHKRVNSQPNVGLPVPLLFPHHRNQSSNKKQEVVFEPKIKKISYISDLGEIEFYGQHQRRVSDVDSVVYVDPDESISCDKRTDTNPKGTFIHHENSTTSDPKDTVIRASLQSLGLMPCTAYCWLCRQDVHTNVRFQSMAYVSDGILGFFHSLMQCCKPSVWFKNKRVHECMRCRTVLGRV